jgi:CRP-like cAMP-binding protein
MEEQVLQGFAACPIFQSADKTQLAGLLEEAGTYVESHPADSVIRQQGQRYDDLIVVISGRIEARIDDVTGRGITVEHFGASTAIATGVLISSEPVLPVTLISREETFLAAIPYDGILKIFAREPMVLRAYLQNAGDKVRFLAEKLRLIRFDSLRKKIAGHLLSLASSQNSENPRWRYSREQTADLLGVARPSLSGNYPRWPRKACSLCRIGIMFAFEPPL